MRPPPELRAKPVAKGILMKRRGCDEEEAYSFMRKTAMDQKLRLADVAAKIIAAAELLG